MSLLEIKNLTKRFGGITAVDRCSFSVKEGEILGLIGPNGSGKTTVFNLITGIYRADKGTVNYKGEPLAGMATYEIAQLGIGRTFQLIRLFPKLTVMDNMLLALRYVHGERVWPQLLKKKHVDEEDTSNRKRAMQLLRAVALHEKANDLAQNLSYGQQKLLEISRALATEPDTLLLDEPIAGVNPTMAKKILSIIKQLNRQGKTIVMVEHNMNIVMKFCQRIVVLDYGREIAAGKPAQIRRNKKVIEAYLGKKKH